MNNIRLIREVSDPGARGPSRGMFALQSALRADGVEWLKIGGCPSDEDIPWLWSYTDHPIADHYANAGMPFVIGPNYLFGNSARPGQYRHERIATDASSCVLQFTESPWYADLIASKCTGNKAPIVLWSYPIEPKPKGPLPAKYDAMIYLKDRSMLHSAVEIQRRFTSNRLFIYGQYDRDEMIECARRSRCCFYMSSDDRGPLALAEIMLAGCPAVGLPRGAPWIIDYISGRYVSDMAKWPTVVDEAMSINRNTLREWSLERFSTERTLATIYNALQPLTIGVFDKREIPDITPKKLVLWRNEKCES